MKIACLNILMLTMLIKSASVFSAPITFNTALPVAKGEYLARLQYIVNQSGKDQSQLERDRSTRTTATVLGYGVNSKLALFGVLPVHSNSLTTNTNNIHNEQKATGLGDTTLFARYTVLQRNQKGQSFRLAPFAGIKAPTGEDDRRDASGVLPPSAQLGTGSWDPLFGIISTYQTLDYQIDAQLGYQLNTEANNYEAGDIARLDGSLQYRFWPGTLSGRVPGFLYGVIETNLIHQQSDKLNAVTNKNSGGNRLFISPGIQYVTRRWIIETALQIPVIQNLNGTGLENDYIARISGRFNF
ncbi:MAG TPA: transporter [Gammaproteobacteria bacterium]|nr:transporter [Gammaproteobacteria bacterium]